MEYYWNMFNNSTSTSNSLRGHNGNFTTTPNHAWQFSDLATSSSRVDWTNNSLNYPLSTAGSEFHTLLQEDKGPHHCKPDPHLTCLNLGKRHYFENVNGAAPAIGDRKKGKLSHRENTTAPPRCQVEGCEAMLVNAKDYHRRHKVCERHAKAPRVVVLGIEQRFCQQCSRFHVVGEFDEAKRSCRRRLAGHNERRRKTSQHPSLSSIKPSQGIHPHYLNSSACAHSLLSSVSNPNIPATANLPARCSVALHELIAENRASILAYKQQLNCNQIEDPEFNNYTDASIRAELSNPRFFNMHENEEHVTLNLMRDPNSGFSFLPVHDHDKSTGGGRGGEEDSCSELWKYPLGY